MPFYATCVPLVENNRLPTTSPSTSTGTTPRDTIPLRLATSHPASSSVVERTLYDSAIVRAVGECVQSFQQLTRLVRALPASLGDCVHALRIGEHVLDVRVREQFLEKQMLQWWSLDRLSKTAAGQHCGEELRTVFLPTVELLQRLFLRYGDELPGQHKLPVI